MSTTASQANTKSTTGTARLSDAERAILRKDRISAAYQKSGQWRFSTSMVTGWFALKFPELDYVEGWAITTSSKMLTRLYEEYLSIGHVDEAEQVEHPKPSSNLRLEIHNNDLAEDEDGSQQI